MESAEVDDLEEREMMTPDEFVDAANDIDAGMTDTGKAELRALVAARDEEHAAQLVTAVSMARLEGWNEGMEDAKAATLAFGKKYRGARPHEIANAIDSVKIAGPEHIPVNGCEEGAVRR